MTNHAGLTGTHGAATISGLADIVAHSNSTAVHGAGTLASLADLHSQQHTVAASADHLFPGGTAAYLRADGTFAEPPTGSGTPSGTVIAATAYGAGSAAGTSLEYSRGDHTHGSPADLVSGTAHASLTTGVHSLGTMAKEAASDYFLITASTTHAASDATHGAGTIASMTALSAHAALTSVHSLATMAFQASAGFATTTNFASHTASATSHGAGTIAGLADIVTHANLTATHGIAGTIAAKADITDTILITADNTTNDVTSTKHGFAPKSPANTGLFLRGDTTPSWAAPPGGAGILSTTYKAGTQSFSSTALTNVTGMNFACASTTIYHYKFLPMFKSGTATVGLKWSVTYPASTIAAGRVSMMVTASGTTAYFHGLISASGTAVTGTSVVAANTIGIAVIEGIVRATAAGSIQLQAAAEAAGTVWVMDNSVGLLYAIF